MRIFSKQILPGIAILFLVALVAGLFFLPRPTRSVEQSPAERVADVRVLVLRPAVLEERIELPATAEPFVATEVAAEISGRVDWIGPNEGAAISEGAPFMRIDQRTFGAQVEEAQADYNLAKSNCDRTEQLYHEGIISKERVDQCEAQLTTALAKLDVAKLQFEKGAIRSPLAGVLNELYFDVGEYVRQGDKVADIVVIDPIKMLVKIPERDIGYLDQGKRVDVVFGLGEQSKREGIVTYISVIGNEATRTYDVEVTAANPSRELLPSMITRVRILKQEIPDAIMVPLFSVIPRGDFKVVFVEKDGRAEERQVELGILEGNRVQILDGLQPGEHLIIEGHRELSDGEAVRVQGFQEDLS